MNVRRLRKIEEDRHFFQAAEQWQEAYPTRWKEVDRLEGHRESMWEFADDPNYIHIGYEDEAGPLAILTYRHTKPFGWFEMHLDARRGFTKEQYADVAWRWGWSLFEDLGASVIFAWIADTNRASRRIGEAMCLRCDGTVRWLGVYKGKIIRTRRYCLTRETWQGWLNGLKENNDGTETGTGVQQPEQVLQQEPEYQSGHQR